MRWLTLAAFVLLVQACITAGPPGNVRFANVENVAALEGVYQNLGERHDAAPPVYLSALIWPEGLDHRSITTVEVRALDRRTLAVKANSKEGVAKEGTFVEGRDFELSSGRIVLKKRVGFIGLIESEAHAVGPTYEQRELGIDRKGHGKLSQQQTIVGLVMMIPMAIGTREDVRFRRIDR